MPITGRDMYASTSLTEQNPPPPPAAQQLVEPVLPPPIFPWPLPRPTLPTNVFLSRRNGEFGPTGDTPEKAVPIPRDSAHLGEPAVRPALPSSVTARRLPRICEVPKPRSRLRAWVEST